MTKINFELEEWEVKALRNYFGSNDSTQISHWAYEVFNNALYKENKDDKGLRCCCINWHPSKDSDMGKQSVCSYCNRFR